MGGSSPSLIEVRCICLFFFFIQMYFSFPVLLLEWTGNVKLNLDGEIKKPLLISNILRKPDSPNNGWISNRLHARHVWNSCQCTHNWCKWYPGKKHYVKILCPKVSHIHSVLQFERLKRRSVAHLEVGTHKSHLSRGASSLNNISEFYFYLNLYI